MWRAALCLSVALLIGVPSISHGQASDLDSQNPKEYTDDDSQPLKIVSYAIAPVGWLLEWTVARPLHYLATDTPLAPVLGANINDRDLGPLPVAELPPPDVIATSPEPRRETEITRGAAPITAAPAQQSGAPALAPPPAGANQPALH
jgi:hypothetical protein